MKKKVLTLALAVCMAASLAGCSSGSGEETTATAAETKKTEESAAKAEETTEKAEETTGNAEESKASGNTLVMATNAEFPPYEFYEGGEIVGIDVEIAKAIAEEMGMDFEVEDMAFDSIIPAVQSGKADFGAAGMTVDEKRIPGR